MTRAAQRLLRAFGLGALVVVGLLSSTSLAAADDKKEPTREARYTWNYTKSELFVDVSFRDVIDPEIKKKLSRGLPTQIVLTGTMYQAGKKEPVSTSAQTCKITWHVWDEVYLIEVTRPGSVRQSAAATPEGVLRRCAEARRLLVATSGQADVGAKVYMTAKVQVNPVSQDVLQKIKRWVSRPSGTGTAAPGDALFSTFTGLFLQRIGEAERELQFTTTTSVPQVEKPPPPKEKK